MSLDRVLLIVPCYNEALRLKKEEFLKLPEHIHVLFVNDCSTDSTKEILNVFVNHNANRFYVHHLPQNQGKGNAVHSAYTYAKHHLGDYQWIGFWDADLATPLEEVEFFLQYASSFSPHALALFGSRINRFGASVRRKKLRHYLSRLFVTVTDWLLGVRAYDSQCGAKLFHKSIADKALGARFVSKWVFDLEIILRVGAENIVEVPVQSWRDVPGSKVRLWRDALLLIRDLYRIRKLY